MTTNVPFVSIIVPVHNCENRIEKCIQSLLNQDYPKDRFEIIIVDNNSQDKTKEIIKKYPVQYAFEGSTQTSYAARNTGVRASKGDIIAFTDDDCIPFKNWLSEGVSFFNQIEIGCVAGEIIADEPQNYIEEYLNSKCTLSQKWTMKHKFLPYPQTANAFYKKDVFNKIGYFEEKWPSGGDADFAWRMRLNSEYKLILNPKSVVKHRHRSTLKSMYIQKVKWGVGRVLLYKKYKIEMGKRKPSETLRDLKILFFYFTNLIKAYVRRNKTEEGRKISNRVKCYLDLVDYGGGKIGELTGSIRYGVYYV